MKNGGDYGSHEEREEAVSENALMKGGIWISFLSSRLRP
jgi:hypothetical protein